MSTSERIAELKSESSEPLFRIHHPNRGEILARSIPLKVYLELMDLTQRGILTEVEMENIVFRTYVLDESLKALYPDLILAGEVTVIAKEILTISEPGSAMDIQGSINYFMNMYQDSVYEKIEQLIIMAYPTYTPDIISKMPWAKLVRLVSKAQLLLLERGVLKKPLKIWDKKQRKKGFTGAQIPGGEREPPPSRLPPEEQERQRAAVRRLQQTRETDKIRSSGTIKRKGR